jgi:hypothetical protein
MARNPSATRTINRIKARLERRRRPVSRDRALDRFRVVA